MDALDFYNLRSRTIIDDNILLVDGFYRYVNHSDKVSTSGFGTRKTLLKYSGNFRFDSSSLGIMKDRYIKQFPNEGV